MKKPDYLIAIKSMKVHIFLTTGMPFIPANPTVKSDQNRGAALREQAHSIRQQTADLFRKTRAAAQRTKTTD